MPVKNWMFAKAITSVPLSSPAAKQLAASANVKIINGEEQKIISPNSLGPDEYMAFEKLWNQHLYSSSTDRLNKYALYDVMDNSMMEAARALDVYADEMFSVANLIAPPIEIVTENVKLKNFITEVLRRNGVLRRYRADGRQLVKDGDFAYEIKTTRQYDNSVIIGKNARALSPEEIQLIPRRATSWEILYGKGTDKIPLYYRDLPARIRPDSDRNRNSLESNFAEQSASEDKLKTFYPWNFIQFSVFDYTTYPYGRGLMDRIAIAFDRLATMETLVALARASKLEKTLIKIPVNETNPELAMQRIQQVKTQFKNTMFADTKTQNVNSYNRIASLNEQIWMPAIEGFTVETLKSDVELGNIDDLKYFQDQAFNGTGLPRSFFLNDDTNTELRQGALKEQYAMFARALQPYTLAYLEGLVKMTEVIAVLGGFDPRKRSDAFRVVIKEPIQFKKEILDSYFDILQKIAQTADAHNRILGKDSFFDKRYLCNLSKMMGIPKELADMFYNGVTQGPDFINAGKLNGEVLPPPPKINMNFGTDNNPAGQGKGAGLSVPVPTVTKEAPATEAPSESTTYHAVTAEVYSGQYTPLYEALSGLKDVSDDKKLNESLSMFGGVRL